MHTMGTCTWTSRGATRNTVSRHTKAVQPCSLFCRQIRPVLSKLTSGELPRWLSGYFPAVLFRVSSDLLTGADIYGNMKKVKKSKSYLVHGMTNLIGIQDKKEYARSKKIFQQGFSDTANREHEPKIIREIDTFIEKISENETPEKIPDGWSNPKNMTLWCMFSVLEQFTLCGID
jgi:hypothetical protein